MIYYECVTRVQSAYKCRRYETRSIIGVGAVQGGGKIGEDETWILQGRVYSLIIYYTAVTENNGWMNIGIGYISRDRKKRSVDKVWILQEYDAIGLQRKCKIMNTRIGDISRDSREKEYKMEEIRRELFQEWLVTRIINGKEARTDRRLTRDSGRIDKRRLRFISIQIDLPN